ncbi:MAG: hypothetical protein NC417_01420 [Candidatus Gastranaerophilales bacterium]|nr:hypothetical protein [Candidatus Gastranaerophilales bacterium]
MVLNALPEEKVTKSDQKIISFSEKKKAENFDSSKLQPIKPPAEDGT